MMGVSMATRGARSVPVARSALTIIAPASGPSSARTFAAPAATSNLPIKLARWPRMLGSARLTWSYRAVDPSGVLAMRAIPAAISGSATSPARLTVASSIPTLRPSWLSISGVMIWRRASNVEGIALIPVILSGVDALVCSSMAHVTRSAPGRPRARRRRQPGPVYHHRAQPAHRGGDAELEPAGSPQALRSIPDPYGRRHPENT